MTRYFTCHIGDDGLKILQGLKMDGTAVALVEEKTDTLPPPWLLVLLLPLPLGTNTLRRAACLKALPSNFWLRPQDLGH